MLPVLYLHGLSSGDLAMPIRRADWCVRHARWPYPAQHTATASAPQGMDEGGQQFVQHAGMGGGESFSQQRRPIDIVGSGAWFVEDRPKSLEQRDHGDGPVTFCYPATTRQS